MFLGIRWILLPCTATMTAQQVAFVHHRSKCAERSNGPFEDKRGGIWMGGNETGAEGLA